LPPFWSKDSQPEDRGYELGEKEMLNHKTISVKISVLRDYMVRLLRAVGFDEETALTVADTHLESDLRGIGIQGFNHLINSHLQQYLSGQTDPAGKPAVVKKGVCYALIDGHSGPGPIAALFACDVTIRIAKEVGCAVVGVINSHDLFQIGLYAEKIALADLVGMAFSDDVVPVCHPMGGVAAMLGSNPMAWAAPTSKDPFILDFTPAAITPTMVRYTQRYGGVLPPEVAIDVEGKPTTDPSKVTTGVSYGPDKGRQTDKGAIDPGGHRGYGMLLMIDFLSGALLGADMNLAHVTKDKSNKGHLFIAIDPGIFGNPETFKRAVTARINEIKASKKAPGISEIRVPGERNCRQRRACLESGEVLIDSICWDDGVKLGKTLGVKPPPS
jgi:LDH2 family malate/lactate/ureidoglycolate dehydrogenase